MFNKKDLDSLLGVGRVRAPISEETSIPPDEIQTEEVIIEETPKPVEVIEIQSNDRLLAVYENQIAFLQNQLSVKDEQLNSKDEIIKNFQVLLKLEQDTVIKLTCQMTEKPKSKGWRSWFKLRNTPDVSEDH